MEPETTADICRRRLREARTAKGLSQRDVANRLVALGMEKASQTAIARFEKGERGIGLDEMISLAVALDIAPLALFLPIDDTGPAVSLTPAVEVDPRKARRWARGEIPLDPVDYRFYSAQSAGEVPVSDEELSDDERAAYLAWRDEEFRRLGVDPERMRNLEREEP